MLPFGAKQEPRAEGDSRRGAVACLREQATVRCTVNLRLLSGTVNRSEGGRSKGGGGQRNGLRRRYLPPPDPMALGIYRSEGRLCFFKCSRSNVSLSITSPFGP
jgi:hypothetical protein